jgi:hypothetical protein
LEQDWFAALEDTVDSRVFSGVFHLFVKGGGHYVVGPQEAVSLGAEADKGGVQ